MQFRKLLAGTAVAALMASPAFALSVTLAGANAAVNAPGTGGAALTALDIIENSVNVANETNTSATAVANSGTYILLVRSDNVIPVANNYLITVDVTGGSFNTQVAGDDLQQPAAAAIPANPNSAPDPINFTGTTIQFDGTNRTGEVNDTQVRFLASIQNQADSGNAFAIAVDAQLTCATNLNFAVTLRTEAGNAIEQGTVSLPATAPAARCVDAFRTDLNADTREVGNFDSELLANNNFQQLNPAVAAPGALPNDTGTEGTIGVFEAVYNPAGVAGPIFSSLRDAEDNLPALTGVIGIDITSVRANVSFDQTAGIVGVRQRGAGGAANALTGNTAAVTLDPAGQYTGLAVVLNGTTTVLPTQPTLVGLGAGQPFTLVDFANADLLDQPATLPFGNDLDELNYEGDVCGTFDWVGDSTTSRRNVFRATGFANAPTQGIFATITNSSAGRANATLRMPTTAYTVSNSELSFTDAGLTALFGNFGRADFSFNFITATSVDCDRLQTSPAAAIVTDFGNGTGNTPFGDGDD